MTRIQILFIASCGVLLGANGASHAAKNLGTITECKELKLESAGGFPNGARHSYELSGVCSLVETGVSGGDFTKHVSLTFPVVVRASWNADKHRLSEELEVLGKVPYGKQSLAGKVMSLLACNDDPVLKAGAVCSGVGHKNETGVSALSSVYLGNRAFAAGATTIAEASAVAAQTASASVPEPQPQRKPPGLKSAASAGVAPHVTIRSPASGDVVSGQTLHVDVAGPESLIEKYGVAEVLFEWEWSPVSERLPGRASGWTSKPMLQRLKWTAREGPIFVASIDIPLNRFTESTRWRVRARAASSAVQPTGWTEFSVVPLP